MIPKECKRLAEVDFPIAEVSRHAAREKSIRHGHPSTLHLWWARRPLASSRAVLLALLYPDPCKALCPTEFKVQARKLLPQGGGSIPLEALRLGCEAFASDLNPVACLILRVMLEDIPRLDWNEVTKVAHYYLAVNAMTEPMQVREHTPPYGGSS